MIPAGGSTNVTVSFSPTETINYGNTVTVSSDATSGNDTISATGTGVNVTNFSFGPLVVASLGSSSVTINAWVYPNGAPETSIYDRLGDTTWTIWYTQGGSTHPIFSQVPITGLSPSTEYLFYEETGGGLISQLLYFTTLPAGSLPAIQAESYSPVTASSGQFSATVVPNGQPTTAWFNYTVGSVVFSSPATNVPANDSQLSIGPWIASNLPPATIIYWQVVASNLWGAVLSPMQSFTTLPLPPSIVNLIITNVTSSSAAINVLLNPNGGDSDYTVLATNILTGFVTNTPFTDIGSASSPTNITIQFAGLSSSNAYSACLVATNSGGINFAMFQFTTLPMQYALSASAGSGGSVYPTNVTMTVGYNETFTATPNINYVVNQWLLDGNVVQTGGNTYTLSNIQTNHNVGVTFTYAPTLYFISASAGNGGSIYPTNVTVIAGTNLTYTATPNGGYTVDQWLTNGVAVQSGGLNFTLTNVLADMSVQVTFSVLPGGIISLSGDLAFGGVTVGEPVQNLLEIANTGNETLTVSNINYPNNVFSGDWSGTIAPGDSQYVLVAFLPTAPGRYGGEVTVVSDAVIGTNTIVISGVGLSTNPPPVLNAQAQNGNIILTWPTNAPSFALQFTTNLGPSAIWITVTNTPAVVNGQNALTTPISGQSGFFRLTQ